MLRDFRKRQEEVLELIIRHYIDTAEPVSSRFVARQLGLSSATIRNVMADLEDLKLITHPHTSAGRIPTDKGYRYYIDSLMKIRRLNDSLTRMIDEQYHQTVQSIESVLERTSHLLSSMTNYVGVALYPEYEKVYLDGTSHMLEQPEFKDFGKVYTLLKFLEEKRQLMNLLSEDCENDNITVHIGKELKLNSLSECSIVTRGYKVKGRPRGRVGVIGPTRMLYEKVIPTIEVLANALSVYLEEMRVSPNGE